MYEANEAYKKLDSQGALTKYDQAWERWSSIHRDYPILSDDVMAEDLVDAVKLYSELLSKLDEEFPSKDFPMLRLIANFPDEFPELNQEEMEQMADEYEARMAAKDQPGTDDGTASPTDSSDDDVQSDASNNSAASDNAAGDEDDDSSSGNGSSDDAPSDGNASSENAANENVESGDGSEADDLPVAEEIGPTEPNNESSDAAGSEGKLQEALELYQDAQLEQAKTKYDAAFAELAKSKDSWSDELRSKLKTSIDEYRALLGQLNQSFPPDDFPLSELASELTQ